MAKPPSTPTGTTKPAAKSAAAPEPAAKPAVKPAAKPAAPKAAAPVIREISPAPAPKPAPVPAPKAEAAPKPAAKAGGKVKKINLAFQGGGAHGAFSWGVADALLEDGRLEVEGVVGTSAGAMNAAVTTYGLATGGREGARRELRKFWKAISDAGKMGPLQPTWMDKVFGNGSLDHSPMWMMLDAMSRIFSPYELNPLNLNPLRDVVEACVDFDVLRKQKAVKLFLAATNVKTGKVKVFEKDELCIEAVLASACLPFLFQTVEVNGEPYWDGGYMGNPPLFPLMYECESQDIVITHINPINIPEVPHKAGAIFDRINTLSFNSSLMREMRVVNFINKVVRDGYTDNGKLREAYIHSIMAEDVMAALPVSSKLNPDWEHLEFLFNLGREKGKEFLSRHFDKIGHTSSVDIEATFL